MGVYFKRPEAFRLKIIKVTRKCYFFFGNNYNSLGIIIVDWSETSDTLTFE